MIKKLINPIYVINKIIYLFMFKILPSGFYVDYLIHLYRFIKAHKRLPQKDYSMNDQHFFLNNTNEVLNPLRVITSDKEYAKDFIKNVVGEKYVIKTLTVLKTKDEIDNYNYPSGCVAKASHSCNMTQIINKPNDVDKSELKKWLIYNYYDYSRERNYKNLEKKIIVEELILDDGSILDYRFFVNNNKLKFIILDFDVLNDRTRLIYDRDWNVLNFTLNYEKSKKVIPKPSKLPEMIELSERLGKYFGYVRVDFYTDGKNIKVGEISHTHAAGLQVFKPKKEEEKFMKFYFS